jgi:cation diffusion facilitator CzcD-associated flavoprotein CzcO
LSHSVQKSTPSTFRVAIIGTGFSGLCLAIQLKKAGIETVTLFEKGDRVGGTWRDNTYPGAACDTPAFSYCYSFEQKTDWSRLWAPQKEILQYIEHCAEKYDLRRHIRLRTEIASAHFDEQTQTWKLVTTEGEEIEADVLVSGVGQLNRPVIPQLPGLDQFEGTSFHSARWDHGCDLKDKTVAVIGNAASAVQFVPKIAHPAKRVRVFQRSANWMFRKHDRPYTEKEKQRFASSPLRAKLHRWGFWWRREFLMPIFRGNRILSKIAESISLKSMRKTVKDPEMQRALTPDYPLGGKRMLIADYYYKTLIEDHVDLVTDPIKKVTTAGIETRGGTHFDADVMIFATGFDSTAFLAPIEIRGLDDKSLESEWKDGAEAYLGMTVPGFPNFFMMYGPNTNLGHNSILFMLECQANYIVRLLGQLAKRGGRTVEVRRDVAEAFNRWLQRDLAHTAWAATKTSWYKNKAGRITNNWSRTPTRYWWMTRRCKIRKYVRE